MWQNVHEVPVSYTNAYHRCSCWVPLNNRIGFSNVSTSSTLPTKTSASSWLWNSCHRTFPKDLVLVPSLFACCPVFTCCSTLTAHAASARGGSMRPPAKFRWWLSTTDADGFTGALRCFHTFQSFHRRQDFNIFQRFYVVSCGTQYGVRELHFMMRMLRSWVQQLVAVASCTLLAIFLLRLHMFSVGT